MKKLKVGIILDDINQGFLVHDLISMSGNSDLYSIDALIVNTNGKNDSQRSITKINFIDKVTLKLISKVTFRFIIIIEELFRNFSNISEVSKKIPLSEIDIPKITVVPMRSKSGFVLRYSEEDLELISSKNLDMLVRGCGAILRGRILEICKYGIISFHHGNNDLFRGGPPGFWEVLKRTSTTGFIIQRLCEELDGGDVYYKGSIPTLPFFSANKLRLYKKSNIFMHKFIEQCSLDGRLPNLKEKRPYFDILYTTPNLTNQLLYILKTLSFCFIKIFEKSLSIKSRWGVAYQYCDSWQSAVLWKSKLIKNPPNSFLADPFPIRKNGSDIIYMELYNYKNSKGTIVAYEVTSDKYKYLGTALEEDFHLSYPNIFEVDGVLYMCPETYKADDIRLYKCVEFPLKWELHKVLIKNISAVDTSIFKHDGIWWLITNIDSSDCNDHDSELHIYHSDSFDSDNWQPHKKNPVIFDSRYARNGGGILHEDGKLRRVFQSQKFGIYGFSSGISNIETLSITEYKEKKVVEILPRFLKNIQGTHTFSYSNGLLAIDYVKRQKIN